MDVVDYITPYALEKHLKATIIKHLFGATIYHIWIERNQRVFHSEAKTEECIFNDVRVKLNCGRKFTSSLLNKTLCKLWRLDDIIV